MLKIMKTKNNAVGRPKIENPRSERLTLSLSASELAQIENAKPEGIHRIEFIRNCVLSALKTPIKTP